MKELLFIVHMFYPETASTGQLMTELCLELNKKNEFNISVIATSSPYSLFRNDNELKVIKRNILYELINLNGIKVFRTRDIKYDKRDKKRRLMHIFTYFISALLVSVFVIKRVDLVFSISQPPIIGGLLGRIAKKIKRAKFVYNIQDFNPEQSEAVKYTTNKLVNNIARRIDIGSCRAADKVVLVGRDMLEYYNKRCNLNNAVVINNWCDDQQLYPLNETEQLKALDEYFARLGVGKSKIIIGYSGNIGLYYDLENIIKIADKFKENNDIHFVFIGEGAVKKQLIDYCKDHKLDNVTFLPYQPKDKLIYSLNAADVHLVTNQKGIKGISVPSKIYGVMAVGKPVIGVLEEGSEARLLIEESGCGVCVEPGDYDGIINAINELYNKREQLQEIGMRGRKYLEEHCSMENSINKYKQLLLNI